MSTFTIEAIVSGIIVAALVGLARFSFKRQDEFEKVFKYSTYFLIFFIWTISIYNFAIHQAQLAVSEAAPTRQHVLAEGYVDRMQVSWIYAYLYPFLGILGLFALWYFPKICINKKKDKRDCHGN